MKHGLLLLGLACASAIAGEIDRHRLVIGADLALVAAGSELPSWLHHGNGKLRFDEDHDGLRPSRLFADYRGRLTPSWFLHAVVNFNDTVSEKLDLTEAYLAWRPLPASAWRLRGRFGAFYPRLSLEHGEPAWSNRYALSASAINTWIGEELRTLGLELTLSRRLQRHPEHLLSIEGAMFFGNDPLGGLLAWRGWSAHDRQTGLFGKVPMPVIPAIEPWREDGQPPARFPPFEEIDHRPGFYAGASWQWEERLRLKYFFYDNHADPEAETADGLYAWETWFNHLGLQLALPAGFGLLAQWLDGKTRMGEDLGPWRVQDLLFDASYLALTRRFGEHRLTARYEWFDLQPYNDPQGITNQDKGNVLAVAWLYRFRPTLRIGAEYLRIESRHCRQAACAWVFRGLPRDTAEDRVQLTLSWQFTAGRRH